MKNDKVDFAPFLKKNTNNKNKIQNTRNGLDYGNAKDVQPQGF